MTELRKVIQEMGSEADETLKARVPCLSKENDELSQGLSKADSYIKESESMTRSSWNALQFTCDFLTSLGLHSPEPRHDSGDGVKSLGLIVPGLRTAAAVVETLGDHCAHIAWIGALHIMRNWAKPEVKEVKSMATKLWKDCRDHLPSYLAIQAGTDDQGKTFGRGFWLPVGKALSRSQAAEAARQAAGGMGSSAHPSSSTPSSAKIRAGSSSGTATTAIPATTGTSGECCCYHCH